ncbi:MAG: glycosyltransferase family 4 protein [Alicyclobacillus sp.]|nr:glycosyltransferase family 4 protein [Alicyclobacillus sp.]
MHVWVLTNEYEPRIIGGLGVVATRLSRALADLGAGVSVIAPGSRPAQPDTRTRTVMVRPQMVQEGTVRVLRIPKGPPWYNPERRRYNQEAVLAAAARHLAPPDLVHVHSVEFAYVALYLRRHLRVPGVYTCHSLVRDEPASSLRQAVLRRQERLLGGMDRVVVPSEWQRNGLLSAYPACGNRVRVISNGVDLPENGGSDLMPASWPSAVPRILFAGRLVPLKGMEELLSGVAVLQQRGVRVVLDVVGRGGSYQARLAQRARDLGIENCVRWLGFRPPDEMPEEYARHDIVVVPSKRESFGLVALEALAHGVPLVSTRSGGLADFVDDQVAEIIPRVGRRWIAQAVEQVLQNPDRARERVREGRHRAEHFRWSRVAERYAELFRELVPEYPTGSGRPTSRNAADVQGSSARAADARTHSPSTVSPAASAGGRGPST